MLFVVIGILGLIFIHFRLLDDFPARSRDLAALTRVALASATATDICWRHE
jgi:hypothetical protein